MQKGNIKIKGTPTAEKIQRKKEQKKNSYIHMKNWLIRIKGEGFILPTSFRYYFFFIIYILGKRYYIRLVWLQCLKNTVSTFT